MAAKLDETVYYSERIDGDDGNYNWQVRFDDTDGYIGITQFDAPEVNESQRVLLSPGQVDALEKFLKVRQ